MKKTLLLLAVGLIFVALPSYADTVTFTLNNSTVSGGTCTGTGCGPFGTVQITQQTSNSVLVTETLNASTVKGFVSTGAGDALDFDIVNSPGITISGLTSGFTSKVVGPYSADGAGSFQYAIDCGSACGSGGSNPDLVTLSFVVQRTSGTLSPTNFVSLNSSNFYVASDVMLTSGKTGMVEATGYSTQVLCPNLPVLPWSEWGLSVSRVRFAGNYEALAADD